jgi:F420-dependent oxidoreductase-like protein
MDIGLMVEGQNGLAWEQWLHHLQLAERLGLASVHRSDHYFIQAAQQQSSIEAYLSLAVAAVETERVRFGPLVSPVTFRRPVDIARMAAQLDVLSGGRFKLGVGAGWNEPEHTAYGLPFPPVKERLDRLEEALQLMRALWTQDEATFEGQYFSVRGARMLPKPEGRRPWVTIGGSGEQRTLRLVAEYADEWNCTSLTPEVYATKAEALERHCKAIGRDPSTIRRSMMIFDAIGPTEADVERRIARVAPGRVDPGSTSELRQRLRERGMLVGTADEVAEQLGQYAELGMQEVQVQHLEFDSDDVPAFLAEEIAPRVASL